MSVATSAICQVTPFMRKDTVRPMCRIAKWHGLGLLTGDASGGYCYCDFVLSSSSDVYGQNALWDIRIANAHCNYLLTSPQGGLEITFCGDFALAPKWGFSTGTHPDVTTTFGFNLANLPKYLFHLSTKSGPVMINTQIRLSLVPNVDTKIYVFYVAGYIYDERYLEDYILP